MKVVPAEYQQDAHHWLILHGRYICKARSPTARTAWSATSAPSTDKTDERDMLEDPPVPVPAG